MKLLGKVTWPQIPLFSPPPPPLSRAEARARLVVIEKIGKLEDQEQRLGCNWQLLVERLHQVPERN